MKIYKCSDYTTWNEFLEYYNKHSNIKNYTRIHQFIDYNYYSKYADGKLKVYTKDNIIKNGFWFTINKTEYGVVWE